MTNEEAIKDIEENIKPVVGGKSLEMAIEALQERKNGKWEKVKWLHCKGSGFLCSKCNSGVKNQPVLCGKPMFLYCPFCGAKMRGVEE